MRKKCSGLEYSTNRLTHKNHKRIVQQNSNETESVASKNTEKAAATWSHLQKVRGLKSKDAIIQDHEQQKQ